MEKTKIIALAIMFAIVIIVVLTSKFRSSKQYEVSKLFRLFPFWVKYLGILISVVSIVFHWINLSDEPAVLASFWQFGLLIGFLITCLSKERNEDEMTMSIRLNSIFIAFFSGIVAHVLIVLLDILYGGDLDSYNSIYVTNYVLFMYLIVFHLTKKRMR